MVEIELDGKKVEITEGSMIMHAADKAGTYIPHFCYHKKLSIAANCRMCLVDVEKAPKPMPACATPVTQGMIVRTKSDKAIKAQKSVMEFLLINHPLDCPICDQGGECQLQDLAVGYGASSSRYEEEKRVVFHKDVGPLISMEEMSRCIHCTRCVRFGQEVAGVMELGMIHRGEHSEITTIVSDTVDSELSGNMIDICPVGALTSKPFRYSARTWELSRRKSVSPHDSTGSNLIVQVKNNKVMRVVPLENEDVNECWIADRDRFSYEALNGDDRLTTPMLKQGGEWKDGGLADRAGIRGQRPAPDQDRPRRPKHRHPGQPAQHGGRAVPGRRADARPGQRKHRPPSAPRRVRPCSGGRPLVGHLHRVAVVSCSACWSWVPTCARTIRCLRSASARPCKKGGVVSSIKAPGTGPCPWPTSAGRAWPLGSGAG
jgi:predicted molibdopterin-dependent oxidoreductase YjgC